MVMLMISGTPVFYALPASAAGGQLFCITGICFPLQEYEDRTNVPLINFSKWSQESDLSLTSHIADEGHQSFDISGSSGSSPAGFTSQELLYSGQPLAIEFKNVSIVSNDPARAHPQLSLVFNLSTPSSDSYFVRLVSGPLFVKGWDNNTYFEGLKPYSCEVLNFEKLGNNTGSFDTLKNIAIILQENSSVNSFDFSLISNPPDTCREIGYTSGL